MLKVHHQLAIRMKAIDHTLQVFSDFSSIVLISAYLWGAASRGEARENLHGGGTGFNEKPHFHSSLEIDFRKNGLRTSKKLGGGT